MIAVVATVFGATAGRVVAVEAENALAAILAGTYVGAGVGLHVQANLLKGGCSNAKSSSDKRFRVKSAPWPVTICRLNLLF